MHEADNLRAAAEVQRLVLVHLLRLPVQVRRLPPLLRRDLQAADDRTDSVLFKLVSERRPFPGVLFLREDPLIISQKGIRRSRPRSLYRLRRPRTLHI